MTTPNEDEARSKPSDVEGLVSRLQAKAEALRISGILPEVRSELEEAASALQAAESARRNLETDVLDAALSDRLDDAGSPLTWKEVALASEAARQELERERDRAHKSLRALQEGAGVALAQLGPKGDGPVADFLCAIHREAVCGLLASDDVTNEAGR